MLDPWYITGLVEGEGCFRVSFNLRAKLKTKIEVRPSFSLSLKDLSVIKELREYFGCGGIRFSRTDNTYKYEVRSIADLIEKIVPHFEKYPLKGKKSNDFNIFKKICKMIRMNLDRSPRYLREILELAYKMNTPGNRKYKKAHLLKVLGKVKG